MLYPFVRRAGGRLALGVLLLCAERAGVEASVRSLPRGSFLRRPAATAADLRQQILRDPLVASRYARLFHLSPKRVAAAFGHLYVRRLPRTMVLCVYYVHPGERLGYRIRRVRRGAAIFAFADGTPVLLKQCGNPMRPRGLNGVMRPNRFGQIQSPEPLTTITPPAVTPDQLEAPPLAPSSFFASPALATPTEMPGAVSSDLVPAVEIVPPPTEIVAPTAEGEFVEDETALPGWAIPSEASNSLPYQELGIAIAAIALWVNHSGGSSSMPPPNSIPLPSPPPSGSPSPPPQGNPLPPPSVPEGSSLLLFGSCLLTGALSCGWRQSRKSGVQEK